LERLVVWHSVNDLIVHRSADGSRKGTAVGIWKSLESRFRSVIAYELVCNPVQLSGGDTGTDVSSHFRKCHPYEPVGCAHQFNLFLRLQEYHADITLMS